MLNVKQQAGEIMEIKLNLTEDETRSAKELFLNLLKTDYLTDRQSNTISLMVIAMDKELYKTN